MDASFSAIERCVCLCEPLRHRLMTKSRARRDMMSPVGMPCLFWLGAWGQRGERSNFREKKPAEAALPTALPSVQRQMRGSLVLFSKHVSLEGINL